MKEKYLIISNRENLSSTRERNSDSKTQYRYDKSIRMQIIWKLVKLMVHVLRATDWFGLLYFQCIQYTPG